VKGELNALEFLENVRSTQLAWVMPGTARPESCEGLKHNVSNTCEVGSSEWGTVGRFIYAHRSQFSGLSFLGKSGDYIYRQAPMQKIVLQSELMDEYGPANVGAARHILRHIESRYGSLSNIIVPLKMVLNGVDTEIACKDLPYYHELLWDTYKLIRNLFHLYDSDGAIHLLACINHETQWKRCLEGLVSVDYALLQEEDDLTSLQDTVACGGGACELSYSVGN
jgi:ribonucleoside-diphosphate reductase alpha chain